MSYAASHSVHSVLSTAAKAVCDDVRKQLDGQTPDLSFVFVSHAHAEDFEVLPELLHKQLGSKVLIGCAGETVVGGGEEIEDGSVLSLWSAVLPGAELIPFRLEFGETPDGLISVGYPEDMSEHVSETRAVFLLGEPFTSVPDSVIERLAEEIGRAHV